MFARTYQRKGEQARERERKREREKAKKQKKKLVINIKKYTNYTKNDRVCVRARSSLDVSNNA